VEMKVKYPSSKTVIISSLKHLRGLVLGVQHYLFLLFVIVMRLFINVYFSANSITVIEQTDGRGV
jgi:hypothetical protein